MADGIKFSAGYQLIEEGKIFSEIVSEFRKSIDEVYFAWLNLPSGRGPIADKGGYINWEAQKQTEYELREIRRRGIKLNLLLNGSCWGRFSLSTSLARTVVSIIDYLGNQTGIDSVTVFSPVLATVIKKNFPEISIRASVNMKIGTTEAMQQISELVDGFIIQKEVNRNFEKISALKKWCDKNGKTISILANSGCINFCAVQQFHDNVIAHETEVFAMDNLTEEIPGTCWSYYKKNENWKNLLTNHSWIRPQDIDFYKEYFHIIKLATRINPDPGRIIKAYVERKYNGNLLDLFEPSHSKLLFPYSIENSKFPEDWFEKITRCNKNCADCSYCEEIFKRVLTKKEDDNNVD